MYQPHIVIVGAGIVGLSTAYALLKQGVKHVTVLEQATVDHQRSTSHGLSRLLRFEYGADLFYSELVKLSLYRWKNLERISRRTLYTQTGVLVLGHEGDNTTRPGYETLQELGVITKYLSRHRCTQQFPQFNTQSYDLFTYTQEGGLLQASLCLQTLRDLIRELGGMIYETQRILHVSAGNQLRALRLHLQSGEALQADRVVLATGPWVHRLLGDLHLPVHLTRQYLLYFSHIPASSFSFPTFPAFMADDLYGFPLHYSCTGRGPHWLKVASHAPGTPIEPDDFPLFDEDVIAQEKNLACNLLPALQKGRLAHVDACMYDISIDEDFILDYLPDDQRVVFAAGLSGHGFKFGPLLGELLSNMILNNEPAVSLERFQMARFAACMQKTTVGSVA